MGEGERKGKGERNLEDMEGGSRREGEGRGPEGEERGGGGGRLFKLTMNMAKRSC